MYGRHRLSPEKQELLRTLEVEENDVAKAHAPVAWMVQSGNYIMEELPDGSEVIRNTDLVVTVPRDCVRWITKPPDAMASMDPGRARALAELRAECCRLSELE